MSSQAILQPLVALLFLHTIMFFWMYATRLPAISKLGLVMDPHLPPAELMNKLPANVRWKADNYNHLFEQPTMFYAVVLTLAILGAGDSTNAMLAWGYVALRVVHSLVQVLWNKIEVRFGVYALSSLFLFALIFRAAMLLWS
jgi:hypothetical protein